MICTKCKKNSHNVSSRFLHGRLVVRCTDCWRILDGKGKIQLAVIGEKTEGKW